MHVYVCSIFMIDVQQHQLQVDILLPLISGTNALLLLNQFHILVLFRNKNLDIVHLDELKL